MPNEAKAVVVLNKIDLCDDLDARIADAVRAAGDTLVLPACALTGRGLEELEKLAEWTQKGSLCGLGRTAPNPVLSTLKYFRQEYEAHLNGTCPTGKCTALINYSINDDCIGCTKCAQKCPVDAIPFQPLEKHMIKTDLCIKCDACRQACPVNAVVVK